MCLKFQLTTMSTSIIVATAIWRAASALPRTARAAGGHFTPERPGKQPRFERESVRWVGVFTVESGDADATCRENRRIDEGLGRGNALHSANGVYECDEGVGLTPAVLRSQSDDGGHLSATSRQPQANGLEQFLHATRRVALGEECRGVEVVGGRRPVHHAREVRHEFVVADGAREHIGARTAGIEDCRQTHKWPGTLKCMPRRGLTQHEFSALSRRTWGYP